MNIHAVAAAALMSMTVAASSFGEAPRDASVPHPEDYGGATLTAVNYASLGWTPSLDGQWVHIPTSGWAYRFAGNGQTCTNVHLPSGARLEGITTYTNDTDAAASIAYTLLSVDLATNTGGGLVNFPTTGAPGIERLFRPISPAITINNDRRTYTICAFHTATGSTLQNAGATFWYRLQVSPAPATATFPNDVPTSHPLFRYVEALAASGVSGGCAAGSFCPEAPITRGQMAVFLSVALGMHFPN